MSALKNPKSINSAFRKALMSWNSAKNCRNMPWKGEKSAYRIWLSEIILQQTRVEQGRAYYEKFITHFPKITDLAAAPDNKIMKLWEGLGYYSRCRNLIHTARYISTELNGKFPDSYENIQQLKGVGPYTAAAIASFAFNLPHAVVDGNVYRVLARIFGINTAIDSTEGKKQFALLAQQLLDTDAPGLYNQAIMDFGAEVCKPQSPLCLDCPMQKICVAYKTDSVAAYPVKAKKRKKQTRYFQYFLFHHRGELLVRERTEKDIWLQLYDFPLHESSGEQSEKEAFNYLKTQWNLSVRDMQSWEKSKPFVQQLSHQKIIAEFYSITLTKKPPLKDGYQKLPYQNLKQLAFPRLIRTFLSNEAFITS